MRLLAECSVFPFPEQCLQYKATQLECAADTVKRLSDIWDCGNKVMEYVFCSLGIQQFGVTGTLNLYKLKIIII